MIGYIIALGSNMGESADILRRAAYAINALEGTSVEAGSALYRTPPWGYADQDDFINAVIKVRSMLAPSELYRELARLEQESGRVRTVKNGPRPLDLDIILADGIISSDPAMTLPHPRALSRAFVLVPLCDIAPDALFPGSGLTAAQALSRLAEQERAGIVRLDTPPLWPPLPPQAP